MVDATQGSRYKLRFRSLRSSQNIPAFAGDDVPLFIANGDIIRVDTAGKKYLGKE